MNQPPSPSSCTHSNLSTNFTRRTPHLSRINSKNDSNRRILWLALARIVAMWREFSNRQGHSAASASNSQTFDSISSNLSPLLTSEAILISTSPISDPRTTIYWWGVTDSGRISRSQRWGQYLTPNKTISRTYVKGFLHLCCRVSPKAWVWLKPMFVACLQVPVANCTTTYRWSLWTSRSRTSPKNNRRSRDKNTNMTRANNPNTNVDDRDVYYSFDI